MADINMQELRELVEFLKQHGIAEFELDREDQHVRLKFESAAVHAVAAAPALHYAMPAPIASAAAPASSAPATSAPAPAPAVESLDSNTHTVKSPIVGTFYDSSGPGAAPFIKVGDEIEVGQVLCIVEAMKLMNEIESDVAGEVVKIIAKSGSPVEYGQSLFAVKAR